MSEGKKLIIVSAPSGTGKTTIVREVLKQLPNLSFSISAASRDPRGKEKDGEDYYFLGVEGFKQAIAEDRFLEFEEVYPNQFYGTLNSEVERIWALGHTVIFDMDVVGGLNLKSQFGDRALALFIKPPSFEALRERLVKRQTETEDKIAMRLAKAEEEISRSPEFDVVIVNDNLQEAIDETLNVIKAFIES